MNTGPIFGAADVNIINLFLIKLMKLCLCNISVVIWRMEKGRLQSQLRSLGFILLKVTLIIYMKVLHMIIQTHEQ